MGEKKGKKETKKKESKGKINVTDETVYVLLIVILLLTLIVGVGNYIFDKAIDVTNDNTANNNESQYVETIE